MRITIVVGGRWHAFDLARELEEKNHLHRIITNYPRWVVRRWGIPNRKIVSLPLTFWLIKAIYKLGGEDLMMRCQWIVHSRFAKRAAKHLEGSELIHGWSSFSEPSLQWAQKNNIPTILERSSAHILEQSSILREEYASLGLQWTSTHPSIEKMEQREYNLCTKITVPSRFVECSFLDRGYQRNKLYRNALGVNTNQFEPPTKSPEPPINTGLKAIFAGTLSVQKGVHHLLKAFAEAGLEGSQLILLGNASKDLDHLLNHQPDNVILMGHRPQNELCNHYQRAHCFVIASVQEGMAMVQMQALACGLPLICTKHSGGEDLLRMQDSNPRKINMGITEYNAGYVVPIRSSDVIAWCLRELALKPGLWEVKRQSALEIGKNELSWAKYGARTIQNYEELLSTDQP